MTRVVIDIPDKDYTTIEKWYRLVNLNDTFEQRLFCAIAHGTVLPEGGDSISRSELKKSFEKWWGCDDIPSNAVEDLIDNAPTVEPEKATESELVKAYTKGFDTGVETTRPQGVWIPVSERLPEEKLFNPSGSDFGFDFEEVLCTTIWGDVRAYKFGKPEGHDKPHFWLGGGIMDEYVIAWQPLPKPYEKGSVEFTSISTGYATYTAEDIRTCDNCKHISGLPSKNGTMEYSGACKNCIAKDKWEQK